jgi:hypothetical protein
MVPLPSCSSVPHQYQLFIPLFFSCPTAFLSHSTTASLFHIPPASLSHSPATPLPHYPLLHCLMASSPIHCPLPYCLTIHCSTSLFFFFFFLTEPLPYSISVPLSNYILSHSSIASPCHCPIAPLSHGYVFTRQVLLIFDFHMLLYNPFESSFGDYLLKTCKNKN